MTIRGSLLLLFMASLLAPPALFAAENDFKVVDGVLVQPLVLPGHDVAEITVDGQDTYYVDLRWLPQDPVRLEARTSITVVGYEGPRPNQIAAHLLKLRDVAPLAPALEPRRPVDLRVIEGVVQSVTRHVMKLRTGDGRTMTVRIGSLVSSRLLRGDRLKVFGTLDADETLAANALVHQASPPAFRPVLDASSYGP
jgi:hypothetical protein